MVELYYTVNNAKLYGRTVNNLNKLGIPHTDIYLKKDSDKLCKETIKYLLECSEYGFREILVANETVRQILRNENYTTNDIINIVIKNPKLLRPLIMVKKLTSMTVMLTGIHKDLDNYAVFVPRERRELSKYYGRESLYVME